MMNKSLVQIFNSVSVDLRDCIKNPEEKGVFTIKDTAPFHHLFRHKGMYARDLNFMRSIEKEIKLLRTSLPAGIWVTGYDDRMDLYSVMIRGPKRTPYEDCLFFFDIQLSNDHPVTPPACHYISVFSSEKINPNLYTNGLVCISLLGTWAGTGTELWTPSSNLLQLLISIQGLILVDEPFYNEPGYEGWKNQPNGEANSKKYNEALVVNLVTMMINLLQNPPLVFKEEINIHFTLTAVKFYKRLDSWAKLSESCLHNNVRPQTRAKSKDDTAYPAFPLLPISQVNLDYLRLKLHTFRQELKSKLNIIVI